MIELVAAIVAIPLTAWAFAWYASKETRAIPRVLAQAQEQVKQEQRARENALKLFLGKVDAQALLIYQQAVGSLEPSGPVYDHAEPTVNDSRVATAEARIKALAELDNRRDNDLAHGFEGHTAIPGEAPSR